ncbi:SRPBCC family protein [Dehalococcoidia bacterium]|nr:SRPBCC family protein [Dehalococcoidia bacterium]
MRWLTFEKQFWIAKPIADVFEFFANAENLETITPPWLHFSIKTPTPITMRVGTEIDYQLRLHGIPIKWRSEITAWEPPNLFVDVQRKGPYRHWIHTHRFIEQNGGTIARDELKYAVWGDRLINYFFVVGDIQKIFQYRTDKLTEILNTRISINESAN